MAYCKADTSAKIGFRPYLQTDSFGAAHLSGYGSGLGQGHNPFSPRAWQLHGDVGDGLGAYFFNRPFDPWSLYSDTAPGLHGLGYLGDVDVVAQAADELLHAGHITQAEHDAIFEGSMTFQDVMGFDPTDQSNFLNLTNVFRDTAHALDALDQAMLADPAVAQAIGRDVVQMRQEYDPLIKSYVGMYTAIAGSPPAGLSGLGVTPLIWWAAIGLAAVVTVTVGIYALRSKTAAADEKMAQAQLLFQQNQQQLIAAQQKAAAAGDTISSSTYLKTIQANAAAAAGTGMPVLGPWSPWVKWAGLGLAAFIVLPRVGEMFSGGGGKRQVTKVTREVY